jgi:hypothetical protein
LFFVVFDESFYGLCVSLLQLLKIWRSGTARPTIGSSPTRRRRGSDGISVDDLDDPLRLFSAFADGSKFLAQIVIVAIGVDEKSGEL